MVQISSTSEAEEQDKRENQTEHALETEFHTGSFSFGNGKLQSEDGFPPQKISYRGNIWKG
jgi:hypothetical protein